jgi:hypothetical protein
LPQTAGPPGAGAGFVHKSYSYWHAYGDLIKQVFNGSYGSDMNSSTGFRVLLGTYVDLYSARCRAYLPATHETLAMTQSTERTDKYGNVVERYVNQAYTVEVDSRFAPIYREYARSLGSTSGETLGLALGVASGRLSPTDVVAPGTDMIKFFNTEKCQSAAMRQLAENLLRAAQGQKSLQDAGVRIAGAEAENDASPSQVPSARRTEIAAAAARGDVRAQMAKKGYDDLDQMWSAPVYSPSAYDPQWMGKTIVLRGTVANITTKTGQFPPWMTIYFKESPDAAITVCTPSPDIFEEMFGGHNASALIGKTLQVAGSVSRSACTGKASIAVVESGQVRSP